MTALASREWNAQTAEAVRRSLAAARTVDDLFVVAAIEARERCGYGRAIVLDIADGYLRADITAAPADDASEALRHRVIAAPVPLTDGSLEADLARGVPPGHHAESIVAARLHLEDAMLAPITSERMPIAMLVADRPEPGSGAEEALGVLAHFVGLALTALVLRVRLDELSTEIRYLTASAHALLHEAQNAPISLPRDHGQGPVFAHAGPMRHRRDSDDGLLSRREREIMELVAAGRSNAEIAAELHLSADTVKTYVGRLFRKLGAANRVGAVVAYLQHHAPEAR